MESRGVPHPPLGWSKLGQLNSGCASPPIFPLVPLTFEYLALTQVLILLGNVYKMIAVKISWMCRNIDQYKLKCRRQNL